MLTCRPNSVDLTADANFNASHVQCIALIILLVPTGGQHRWDIAMCEIK